MDPILPLLESTVANYLLSVVRKGFVHQLRSGADFEIRKADGSRILLEVKRAAPSDADLNRLAERVRSIAKPNHRFLLVTPENPNPASLEKFQRIFKGIGKSSKWIAVQALPSELGEPSPGDFREPKTIAELQLASLVGNVERYRNAPIGANIDSLTARLEGQLAGLSRQFSHRTLDALSGNSGPLEERLKLAQRVEQVTVVLSDVVNFSSLVTASRPADLKDAMEKYYRLAREAVFSHGGMLDKFIGDAVLAVFGYPAPGEKDAIAAIRFAQDLIDIGREVLPLWLQELNAVIETGTRVGIATGDLWPINIGSSEIEITLLGDTINLAARLEKNSPPNEMLIDNRTKTKASREDNSFVDTLQLTQVQISPSSAKGQTFPIRAWATNADYKQA
jgi:class 3 adenylate cyclase